MRGIPAMWRSDAARSPIEAIHTDEIFLKGNAPAERYYHFYTCPRMALSIVSAKSGLAIYM